MRHKDYGRIKIRGNIATFWLGNVTMVYGVSELQEDFNKYGSDRFYKKYGFRWEELK